MNDFRKKLKFYPVSALHGPSIDFKTDEYGNIIFQRSTWKIDNKTIEIIFELKDDMEIKEKTVIEGNKINKEKKSKKSNKIILEEIQKADSVLVKKIITHTEKNHPQKSYHSIRITYECSDLNNLDKISSLEYIDTDNGYVKTNRFFIIPCPYNTTAIVIVISPYRIKEEEPLCAGVIPFNCNNFPSKLYFNTDYETISHLQSHLQENKIMEKYGYLPLYIKGSKEYQWAMNVLNEKRKEYISHVSYER